MCQLWNHCRRVGFRWERSLRGPLQPRRLNATREIYASSGEALTHQAWYPSKFRGMDAAKTSIVSSRVAPLFVQVGALTRAGEVTRRFVCFRYIMSYCPVTTFSQTSWIYHSLPQVPGRRCGEELRAPAWLPLDRSDRGQVPDRQWGRR